MGNKIIISPPIQAILSLQETPTAPPKISRDTTTHHRTPDSLWDLPGTTMFALYTKLVEIPEEYF